MCEKTYHFKVLFLVWWNTRSAKTARQPGVSLERLRAEEGGMKSVGVPSLQTRLLSPSIFPPETADLRDLSSCARQTEINSLPGTEPTLGSAQLHHEVDLLETVDRGKRGPATPGLWSSAVIEIQYSQILHLSFTE